MHVKRIYLIIISLLFLSKSYSQNYREVSVLGDTFYVCPEYFNGNIEFPDSLPDGKWIQYHKQDSTKIAFMLIYLGGKPNGEMRGFHSNEIKMVEGYYKEGKRSGEWTWWFENGKIDGHEAWKDDKKNGLWVFYNKQSVKTYQGFYKNGRKEGKWKYYDAQGRIMYEETYKNGKQTGKSKTYKKTGKKVKNKEYYEWK